MSTRTILSILDRKGDITVSWDPNDPADVAKARQEVESLAAAGYSFFLTDGQPADAVSAGQGSLKCRLVTADELLVAGQQPQQPQETPAVPTPTPAAPAPRRGRPRKTETPAAAGTTEAPAPESTQHAVATRPLRGG